MTEVSMERRWRLSEISDCLIRTHTYVISIRRAGVDNLENVSLYVCTKKRSEILARKGSNKDFMLFLWMERRSSVGSTKFSISFRSD